MIRAAHVAGQFYPADSGELEASVIENLSICTKEDALAVIVPHAGYIYSGKVAGSVYSRIHIPDNVILIGPNHTGMGAPASIMCQGKWETPLGEFDINEALASRLLEASANLTEDETAHQKEHSLEVQLPFLYLLNHNASIVPITVMSADFTECEEIGKAIAQVLENYEEEVLIIISSDMNHFESEKITREKDKLAIDRVLDLDPDGLLAVTGAEAISMCGVVPSTIGLIAAKELGANSAELTEYSTSGKTSGDLENVVGYAGIIIK
ncbi:MAG: AmmeMemoRadiSam system protein B [Thermodesulfobacteriota bacterium]